jgi:hypothetical protein
MRRSRIMNKKPKREARVKHPRMLQERIAQIQLPRDMRATVSSSSRRTRASNSSTELREKIQQQ